VTSSSSRPTGTGNSPPARKLAVSPEIAVRFGSARRLTRPFALERVDDAVDRQIVGRVAAEEATGLPALVGEAVERESAAVGEGAAGGEAEDEVAGIEEALQVDAQQLRDLAGDLDHADAQVHLGRGADAQPVDQGLLLAQEPAGGVAHLLGLDGVRDRAVEDDRAVDRPDADRAVRGDLRQQPPQARQVVLDRHLALEQHLLRLVHRDQGRGAAASAEEVDQGRGVGLDVATSGSATNTAAAGRGRRTSWPLRISRVRVCSGASTRAAAGAGVAAVPGRAPPRRPAQASRIASPVARRRLRRTLEGPRQRVLMTRLPGGCRRSWLPGRVSPSWWCAAGSRAAAPG
jgi:hypothetical protein